MLPEQNENLKTEAWVYELFQIFAESHGGNSPTLQQMVELSVEKGRPVSKSNVNYHITGMLKSGLLHKRDGCLVVVGSRWFRPGAKLILASGKEVQL